MVMDVTLCEFIIGSYNGVSPGRRQAIIWSNAKFLCMAIHEAGEHR